MKCLRCTIARVIFIPACILILSTGYAIAAEYHPPELDGFSLHAERDADGDGDGVKETHIRQYFDTAGDSIVSMTTKELTWSWSLNTRGSETGDKNYVIRDSNCDGIFDEVYSLDDKFYVPDCLK